jgi:type IV pilus assembly protein PilC
MASYIYEGTDRNGKKVKGNISANSDKEARTRLRVLGTKVKSVRMSGSTGATAPEGLAKFFQRQKKVSVSSSELAVFTKQLSVMIDAGVAIVQALAILGAQQANPGFKDVIDKVRESVETGNELGSALEKHPRVFDNLFVSLVRAGAASGQLDVMLRRLSIYVEKSNKLKKQLIGALTYPAIIIVIAIAMTSLMLLFVVPMLAKNFIESGKELPGLTQFVIDMSDGLKKNFPYIITSIIVGVIFFRRWKKTPTGKATWDLFLLKLPVFGSLISKISIARFSSTMSTLTASGIAILEALDTCAQAAGNKTIEDAIMKVKEEVSKGRGLSGPMEKSPYFPPMVSSMVAIGEATGRLDTMLEKIAAFYEDDVDAAMAATMKLIEPVMFVVIGGIVGFILIAMYLPVFDLANTVG